MNFYLLGIVDQFPGLVLCERGVHHSGGIPPHQPGGTPRAEGEAGHGHVT